MRAGMMSGARQRRWRHGLGAVLAVLALAVMVFETQTVWLRPWLKAYVRERAGRELDVDFIRIGLDARLQPSITLRRLQVQNASWAATKAPLVQAGEVEASLAWKGLWNGPQTITHLVLRDARVELERQADGLRNWRLSRPDDRGPGRLTVQTLDARRSSLHYIDHGRALELALATEGEPTPWRSVRVKGRRGGVDFDGDMTCPAQVSLSGSGEWFELRARLASAGALLELQGRAHDLLEIGGVEGEVRVSGSRVGRLAEVFGHPIADLPTGPVRAQALLAKEGEQWGFSRVDARVGASDASGSIDFRSNRSVQRPPVLRARLVSRRIDLANLRMEMPSSPANSGTSAQVESAPASMADLAVDWQVERLSGLPLEISGLRASLGAHHGQWRLEPLELQVAGGQVSAELSLDTRAVPRSASAHLRLHQLSLARLGAGKLEGKLDALVALASQGNSVAELLAGVSGEASASLAGASLPAALEAKLGLDGGRWLEALLTGGDRKAITCSVLRLQAAHGVARVRQLGLETQALLVNGAGSIDLTKRSVDLVLTPHRKQRSLLALDKSVRVEGTVGMLKIGVESTPEGVKAAVPCQEPARTG